MVVQELREGTHQDQATHMSLLNKAIDKKNRGGWKGRISVEKNSAEGKFLRTHYAYMDARIRFAAFPLKPLNEFET